MDSGWTPVVLDLAKVGEGKELEEFVAGTHRGFLEEAKGRLVANVAGIHQPLGGIATSLNRCKE